MDFLEKFLAHSFALSDAEDNNSGPLNRGGITDLLLLRTLLAIHQKSWKPSLWKMMGCFVLLAYANLAVSRTLLQQQLLPCYNYLQLLFLWAIAATQAAENHRDEWGLTLYLR